MMTPNEFADKVSTLHAGESFIYFTGELAIQTRLDHAVSMLQEFALILGTDKGRPIREPVQQSGTQHRYEGKTVKVPVGKEIVFLTQTRAAGGRRAGFHYHATKRKVQ